MLYFKELLPVLFLAPNEKQVTNEMPISGVVKTQFLFFVGHRWMSLKCYIDGRNQQCRESQEEEMSPIEAAVSLP